MLQEIVVYVVILMALLIAVRWLYLNIRNAEKGDGRCLGCPLSDSCSKKTRSRYNGRMVKTKLRKDSYQCTRNYKDAARTRESVSGVICK